MNNKVLQLREQRLKRVVRKHAAAVSPSLPGVLSHCIVTRLSHILEKTTQRASRNLGRERKESVEEEEEEEGEIDAATILHAAAVLETPSSDKTGRPVWLPSSVARRRTRTAGCRCQRRPPDPKFKQILTHPAKAWA